MLAVSTGRFAKTIGAVTKSSKSVQSRRRNATQAQKKNIFVPDHLRLPKLEGPVLKRIQDLVQSINSDPAKLARASKVVKIARHRYAQSLAFWQKFKPLYGLKVPTEEGLRKDVFLGVARSSIESLGEYTYALRAYQEKLQKDKAFLQSNLDLTSEDPAKKSAARKVVLSFINGLQTTAKFAKFGVADLVRKGHVEAIKSGEAHSIAAEYVNKIEREYRVTITTAHKLSPSEMTHYTNKFKNTQDERTKVIVTARQDPSIVGGVIYDINGKVTDLSWKHQHELAMAKLAEYNGL